jgi:hypothetical protein
MGADKNSTQEFSLRTQFHSNASASFSCQVHAATEVLLDLGARHNQQPLETRSGKQHDLTAGNQNQSGQFLKPVRSTLWDLASQQAGETGQAGFVQEIPKTPSRPKLPQNTSRTSPPLNKRSHSTTETLLPKNPSRQPIGLNWSDRFGKPVRPVLPRQSGRTQPVGKTQPSN